jgi:hypothetical protein
MDERYKTHALAHTKLNPTSFVVKKPKRSSRFQDSSSSHAGVLSCFGPDSDDPTSIEPCFPRVVVTIASWERACDDGQVSHVTHTHTLTESAAAHLLPKPAAPARLK